MNNKRKIIFVLISFICIALFGQKETGQFSKFGLQTSETFELNKKSKWAHVDIGDQVTIYENYRSTPDTTYFKAIKGEFQFFKHDSINAEDSLMIIPYEINKYYVLRKNNSKKVIENSGFRTNEIVAVYYYSITKIKNGRKVYKLRKTKEHEDVWCNGNIIRCPYP